ncbi:MAG: ABC transporter ATP-binding protein [Phycisphaerales bacterium]|nr:ABC transporter ATP-binding protein [Phycisphaerales bacterium]MCI0629527.1 ABC transporter ATP-binding protein [Phycisphaerales bacterium]MCI0674277.1 ABC transporter ATP-binding protein [Phycisphaerales bacterium]
MQSPDLDGPGASAPHQAGDLTPVRPTSPQNGEDRNHAAQLQAGAEQAVPLPGAEPSAAPDHAPAAQRHSAVALSKPPIIRLVELRKSFGRHPVLRGISLDIPTGQTTVIMGPSGCGKSVLLKHIVALLKPDFGEVWFEDQRIDYLSESRLGPIRRQFGFLFQQSALFDSMTVAENIAFPLIEHTEMTESQREKRVRQVLGMVGLVDTMRKMPVDLSGGQRKRVALARAIVLEPKVILYDEPTTGLDPIRSDIINELILKLQRELRITSVVVTHDLASAFKVADTTVMLHEGKVAFRGTPDELRQSSDPNVQQFLRGEATDEELAAIRQVSADKTPTGLRSRKKRHRISRLLDL